MRIVLLGEGRHPKLPANYHVENIRFTSDMDVISNARRQWDWLLKEVGAK